LEEVVVPTAKEGLRLVRAVLALLELDEQGAIEPHYAADLEESGRVFAELRAAVEPWKGMVP